MTDTFNELMKRLNKIIPKPREKEQQYPKFIPLNLYPTIPLNECRLFEGEERWWRETGELVSSQRKTMKKIAKIQLTENQLQAVALLENDPYGLNGVLFDDVFDLDGTEIKGEKGQQVQKVEKNASTFVVSTRYKNNYLLHQLFFHFPTKKRTRKGKRENTAENANTKGGGEYI